MTTALPPSTASAGSAERAVHREPWIDNLRVVVILGVIGAHVSLIYVLDVGWYYEERTASGIAEAVLAGVFTPGLLVGMGLLFFVAGMLTPPAFERKGARRFVVDRLCRLGLPAVVYLFVLDPAMNVLGDRAVGVTESAADYFRRTYFDDVELGVAWFVAALLIFSLAYAVRRSRRPARPENSGRLRRSHLVKAAAFLAVASFAVRIVWPFLATGDVWGLNLWEYPQMITMFTLGVLAYERRWLADGLSPDLRRLCGRAAAVGVTLAALVAVLITVTDDADPFRGGFRLQATLIPLIEATLTLGMSLWAVDWFRRRWNHAGPLVRGLGRGSFGAYLVHAPITVVVAVALRPVGVPAEVKFLTVYALSAAAAFGIGWLVTRGKVTGRIL